VEQLRQQLAALLEKACLATAQLDGREFYVRRDGFRYVIKQGVLVTVKELVARQGSNMVVYLA